MNMTSFSVNENHLISTEHFGKQATIHPLEPQDAQTMGSIDEDINNVTIVMTHCNVS